ncbi:ATP-binding response regulator [Dawidia soli]|uniref:histidine kinase n=1 Tax=Dawidia soli TaxID=2782352 RepID=A0AAP2GDS9_9BACT|nr:hybrid sensor histidine kinase/response regulator [Dawidia soli]MBT1687649.1 hybrid sensor histidine kinase/response regulator [Dawidia soli]
MKSAFKKELKILMLEDLQDDVGLIEHALSRDGVPFTSLQVDSRDEFVQALQGFLPDVILSDHSLPQFNSIEALKICKEYGYNVPFILVTGTVSEEFAVSCLKQGADDYVLKSNLARLSSAIANSMRQRQVEIRRRQAEAALRKQNEELTKINKELDSFVYSVSHNLRAPLMSVLGLVQLAKMDDDSHQRLFHEYFNRIEYSIHKLDETLKEILDYSRNARSEVCIERVNLRGLIEETFDRMRYLSGSEGIEKEIVVEEEVPLFSDAHRLIVIFNNLVSNSIKYRAVTKERQFIRIHVRVTRTDAFIHFEDNGIGISPELITKIFDMFFRATSKSEGAGLGLYIVKEAIDKLGGSIQVRSDFGEGTVFEMRLPNKQDIVPLITTQQQAS